MLHTQFFFQVGINVLVLKLSPHCCLSGGGKQFQCPSCEKLFTSPKLLVEHIQNNHKKGELKNIKESIIKPATEVSKMPSTSLKIEPVLVQSESPRDAINNRNKANRESDDDGSDTSADESEEDEKTTKGPKQSFACPYCKDPKTAYTSREALENHQKDIFGLNKSQKFFVRTKLQCDQCSYKVGCEATMADHMKMVHTTPESKCTICPFKSHYKAILVHHVANEHR